MDPTLLPKSPSGHDFGYFVWRTDALPDSLLGTMSQQTKAVRVLVIDDDPTIREVLVLLLEHESYVVECADSGDAALTLLGRHESAVDLILADVHMPGMTADELTRRLRLACGPATLLLGISGSQPSAPVIALFDGFLLKPFKTEQVLAALQEQKNRRPGAEHSPGSNPDMHLQDLKSAELIRAESYAPVLNEIIYRQLASSIPSPQLQEMYALCVNDTRKRIAGMRALVLAQDAERFVREAHSIKGGCGMLGATELHRLAAELETNGFGSTFIQATQNINNAAQDVNSLDELSSACDRLERMLMSRV